jgi:H+/Cl- antiporter ClcA
MVIFVTSFLLPGWNRKGDPRHRQPRTVRDMNTRPPSPLEATGMAILGMAVGHVLMQLATRRDEARARRPKPEPWVDRVLGGLVDRI